MTSDQIARLQAIHKELFDLANQLAISQEPFGAATLLHGASSLVGIAAKNQPNMEEEARDFMASAHTMFAIMIKCRNGSHLNLCPEQRKGT